MMKPDVRSLEGLTEWLRAIPHEQRDADRLEIVPIGKSEVTNDTYQMPRSFSYKEFSDECETLEQCYQKLADELFVYLKDRRSGLVIWRARPMFISEKDFCMDKKRYAYYARLVLIPGDVLAGA